MKYTILLAAATLAALLASGAVNPPEPPYKVGQVTLRDSRNNEVEVPFLGEKNLLIFYVDPDHYKQNQRFTDRLEENGVESDRLAGFGVINLKDAPLFPNSLVRSIARKKVEKTGALILNDPNHALRDGWQLGDVNNQFTLIVVSRDGELVYLHKGELSDEEIADFYTFIENYR